MKLSSIEQVLELARSNRLKGFYDMDSSLYHHAENPGISKSALDYFKKSPAHYLAWKSIKPEKTKAMMLGDALHCLVLEPGKFDSLFAMAPSGDKRTKKVQEAWEAFYLTSGDKTPVTPEDFETLQEMRCAVMNHPLAKSLLSDGTAEQTLYWKDESTGVLCRGRTDFVTRSETIVDLKTTEDLSGVNFEKSIFNYSYHMQAAFYLDGYERLTYPEKRAFLFICVEKKAPFGVRVYKLNEDAISIGREKYKSLLVDYAKCLESNVWPNYSTELLEIGLPSWAKTPNSEMETYND